MLGSRLDGAGPVRVLLVGPAWQGEAAPGVRAIRAPSNDVWLLGRWLVDGPEDTPAVHAIQDALRLTHAPQGAYADAVPDPEPLRAPKRFGAPLPRPARLDAR